MKTKLALALLVVCLKTSFALSDDSFPHNWHQWRGPETNGVSRTAEPPVKWSESQNILWKVAIEGRGTSTPIVWGQKVFVLTAIKTDIKDTSIPDPKDQPKTNFFDIKQPNAQHAFVVLCLDRNTGKELWRKTATTKIPHEGAHNDNDFASASPTTDGNYVYCWYGSAGLFCYDLDGKKIWERDLGEAKIESSLGEGCSPVLHNGKLIIVRDHAAQSTIEVLDAKTGETLWSKNRDEGTTWATPFVIEHSGKTQIVTAASGFVRSYDLDTGDIIWQCNGLTKNVIPCPVVDGDYVICMSGYQGYAALAIPLTETGDISGSSKIRWNKERGTPYIPSPLLYDGMLFYNQSNQAILSCIDSKTGTAIFGPARLNGISNLYASPVGASGRIYITGRNGTTLVLERSPELKILATNQLDERFDASPALAGKQLFLRGAKFLYCLANTGQKLP
ncbi:MAG: PQQ-like beta-propeller repeat protein [Rubripirellula sp.]|nr:PQQ-like beta-propeller repeat protein [Rubripirellula sp.]